MAKKKRKISKLRLTRFLVTLCVMITLGLLRTFLPMVLADNLSWILDVLVGAIAFLFIPLLTFFFSDILKLGILNR